MEHGEDGFIGVRLRIEIGVREVLEVVAMC